MNELVIQSGIQDKIFSMNLLRILKNSEKNIQIIWLPGNKFLCYQLVWWSNIFPRYAYLTKTNFAWRHFTMIARNSLYVIRWQCFFYLESNRISFFSMNENKIVHMIILNLIWKYTKMYFYESVYICLFALDNSPSHPLIGWHLLPKHVQSIACDGQIRSSLYFCSILVKGSWYGLDCIFVAWSSTFEIIEWE